MIREGFSPQDIGIFSPDGGQAGFLILEFLHVVWGMFCIVAIMGNNAVAHLHDALAAILEVAAGSARAANLVFVFVVKTEGVMAELVDDKPLLPAVFVTHGEVT